MLDLVCDTGRVERQRAVDVLFLLIRYRLMCARRLGREEPPRHEPRQPKYPCIKSHPSGVAPVDNNDVMSDVISDCREGCTAALLHEFSLLFQQER